MDIRVVLVELEHEGNIGSIARLMKDFGLSELWLVNPKVDIGAEAWSFASHANDILTDATFVKTLDEALDGVGYVVGTTSISAKRSSNLLRATITPQELAQTVCAVKGSVALLLGRESTGLSNEELAKCDVSITIPASPAYRTLNVASAAAIIFYELWMVQSTSRRGHLKEADREYRERLTVKAFKNIICRAFISRREATLIIGTFREIIQRTSLKSK